MAESHDQPTLVRAEDLRPRLHFTPPANWMNDPNGLVRVGEVYHLFYQHNPTGITHANLHWGHATSRDLATWHHEPVALAPDALGLIYSGTAVIDEHNTAGFGSGGVVAAFTHHLDGRQRQSLAYSTDAGSTWAKYDGNPVIDAPDAPADFRDPKVLRYDSETGEAWWVMLVAADQEVWFYTSNDLKDWTRISVLTPKLPREGVVIEVPELIRIPVEGQNTAEWTLLLSILERHPDGIVSSEVLWTTGSFDGWTFAPHRRGPLPLLDLGTHFYAAMAWDDRASGGPTLIGWMDERTSIGDRPSLPWCGRMSIPRRLSLRAVDATFEIVQRPVVPATLEPSTLRDIAPGTATELGQVGRVAAIRLRTEWHRASDAVEFRLSNGAEASSRFTLRATPSGTVVVWQDGDVAGELIIDDVRRDGMDVTAVVDIGSLELFAADGGRVASFITDLGYDQPTAYIDNQAATPLRIEIGELGPVIRQEAAS